MWWGCKHFGREPLHSCHWATWWNFHYLILFTELRFKSVTCTDNDDMHGVIFDNLMEKEPVSSEILGLVIPRANHLYESVIVLWSFSIRVDLWHKLNKKSWEWSLCKESCEKLPSPDLCTLVFDERAKEIILLVRGSGIEAVIHTRTSVNVVHVILW